MVISVVGIPWARAAFNIALLNLWPFGSQAVSRAKLAGPDLGTGVLGLVGNILWFVVCGVWLALMHIVFGILLGITIIGIPFAIQHFKLAALSIAPIGKSIVFK